MISINKKDGEKMICFGKEKVKENDRKQRTEHHKWDNNKEALKAFVRAGVGFKALQSGPYSIIICTMKSSKVVPIGC